MVKSLLFSLALFTPNTLDLAEYSYSTGCYDGVKLACQTSYFDISYYNCLKIAFPHCENGGKNFRKFIANGRK